MMRWPSSRRSSGASRVRGVVVGALVALHGPAAANQFTPEVDAQRRAAEAMLPAQIMLPGPERGHKTIASVRIRFYADDDYRAGLFRWADRVKAQLADLNKVVEPAFGVRFEAEGFRRWHRTSGNIDVNQMLAELEKLDVGPEVDWVVGFVSALPLVSTSMHELGAARLLLWMAPSVWNHSCRKSAHSLCHLRRP